MNKFETEYTRIESEIPKVSELERIPIIENGETLVEVLDSDGLIISFHNSGEMLELMGLRMFVRATVREMLIGANNDIMSIKDSLRIKLFYAYRALEIQAKYYAKALATAERRFPDRSDQWKKELAHTLSACPSVAGHPTGGAVDVTLFDLVTGEDVDMGVPVYRDAIHNAGRRIYTESPEIVGETMKNRLLLKSVMSSRGFAPFSGEFWHFSYGDREWAAKLGKEHAIYDQIPFTEWST